MWQHLLPETSHVNRSYGAGVFKNLFKRNRAPGRLATPLVESDDDIPRYPPFAKGLPAAPTVRIIQTQDELIARIRGALRFNANEFKEIVLPVIERYAAYVHLLPASEAHHHRGAGGLFRHGLEVGFWASQRAESHQFCLGETPQNRRDNEPRWQFASFLGGLLHDVGKPLSDVAVTDKTGKKEWNPYDTSLADWTHKESIDHYFLRWRDKRNKRHEKFSMMNLDQIITPKAKSYLNKPGPHIMEALLEAIVGTSAAESLTQIVLWADQESVRRDLVNQRLDVDEYAYGVPVERFVFDALRRIVETCKINVPGAYVWRIDQGVFLVWNQIVPLIHNVLEQDKVPGVPRSPDTLADILIERGFAVPYQESAETKPVRYWRIFPQPLKGVPLVSVLRLEDPELIFTNQPPAPVKATFTAPAKTEERSEQLEPEDKTKVDQARSPIGSEEMSERNPPPDNDLVGWEQIHEEEKYEPAYQSRKPLPEEMKPASSSMPKSSQETRTPNVAPQKVLAKAGLNRLAAVASQVDSEAQLGAPIPQKKNADTHAAAKATPPPKDRFESRNATHQNAGTDNSPAWQLIEKAMALTTPKCRALERLSDGDYGIPHPTSTKIIGDPKEVMNCLSSSGYLRVDQTATSKTTTIAGKKYLVLNRKISRRISDVFGDREVQPPLQNTLQLGSIESPENIKPSVQTTAQDQNGKLPSLEELTSAFTEQMVRGFGPFISGDVTSEQVEGGVKYIVSIRSINAIAKTLGTPIPVITAMMRGMKNVHSTKTHIEYFDEL